MGRPPLPVGGFGRADYFRDHASGRVRARVYFRDYDGVRRSLSRWGTSRTEADLRLQGAIRERAPVGDGVVSPDTCVRELAELWLRELETMNLAPRTREQYALVVRLYVVPAVGELRVGELCVGVLDRAFTAIKTSRGAHAARSVRRSMSGMCRLAVRHGALPSNPVRDTRPIHVGRKKVRSLTDDEARDLLEGLRADQRAVLVDLPDLVEFMLGTGLRIGEACAVRRSVLDLSAHTVHINATVVRVPGRGVHIQPRTKTVGSERILVLPPHLVRLVKRRIKQGRLGQAGVLFPSPTGMIRDPSNTQSDLRLALDRLGYDWVTSHVFRKTVASRLDDAGFSIRQIADQLGHTRPSTTMDSYLGRRMIMTAEHAAALAPPGSGEAPRTHRDRHARVHRTA